METENGNYMILVAGGTGGHIAPAASIAETLASGSSLQAAGPKSSNRQKDVAQLNVKPRRVLFLTLPKNLDYPDIVNLQGKNNISIESYGAPPLPGLSLRLLLKLLAFPFLLAKSVWEFRRILAKYGRPAGIFAFGGYPCFGALAGARLFSIPIYLHEQNAQPGLVTRLFERSAARIFVSFPDVKGGGKGGAPGGGGKNGKKVFTGNPLRPLFLKSRQPKVSVGVGKGALQKKRKLRVLIAGGSQGAKDLCLLYEAMIADPRFELYQFTISSGAAAFEWARRVAEGGGREADRVFSFIQDMPQELAKADIVIARAGSGTIFEILWAKKPSILFPYPYAKDNHQKANADILKERGVCELIEWRGEERERLPLVLDTIERWISAGRGDEAQAILNKGEILPLDGHERIAKKLTKELTKELN